MRDGGGPPAPGEAELGGWDTLAPGGSPPPRPPPPEGEGEGGVSTSGEGAAAVPGSRLEQGLAGLVNGDGGAGGAGGLTRTFRWRIEGFSSLHGGAVKGQELVSDPFFLGSAGLVLKCLPRGAAADGAADALAVFLAVADPAVLGDGAEVDATFTLSVVNQKDPARSVYKLAQTTFNCGQTEWGFGDLVDRDALMDPAEGVLAGDSLLLEVVVSEGRLLSNLARGLGLRYDPLLGRFASDDAEAEGAAGGKAGAGGGAEAAEPEARQEDYEEILRYVIRSAEAAGYPKVGGAVVAKLLEEEAVVGDAGGPSGAPSAKQREEAKAFLAMLAALAKEGGTRPNDAFAALREVQKLYEAVPALIEDPADLDAKALEQGLQRVQRAAPILASYDQFLKSCKSLKEVEELVRAQDEEMEELRAGMSDDELDLLDGVDGLFGELEASGEVFAGIVLDGVVLLLASLVLVDTAWFWSVPAMDQTQVAALCSLPAVASGALKLANWRFREAEEVRGDAKDGTRLVEPVALQDAVLQGWARDVLPTFILGPMKARKSSVRRPSDFQMVLELAATATRAVSAGCVLGALLQLGMAPGWAASTGPLLGTPEESFGGLVLSNLSLATLAAPSCLLALLGVQVLAAGATTTEWRYQLIKEVALGGRDVGAKAYAAYSDAWIGIPQVSVESGDSDESVEALMEEAQNVPNNSEFSRYRAQKRMGPYQLFGFLSSGGFVPKNWFQQVMPRVRSSGNLAFGNLVFALKAFSGVQQEAVLMVAYSAYLDVLLWSSHSLIPPLATSLLLYGETAVSEAFANRQRGGEAEAGEDGGTGAGKE